MGDASSVEGLAAPYNEEATESIFKIEPPQPGRPLLQFWFDAGNTDLHSTKDPELQEFERVGSRCDPHMKAFYETLLARHKARLQVLVAEARKLIHTIYGILGSKAPYDGRKLFPALPRQLRIEPFLYVRYY